MRETAEHQCFPTRMLSFPRSRSLKRYVRVSTSLRRVLMEERTTWETRRVTLRLKWQIRAKL